MSNRQKYLDRSKRLVDDLISDTTLTEEETVSVILATIKSLRACLFAGATQLTSSTDDEVFDTPTIPKIEDVAKVRKPVPSRKPTAPAKKTAAVKKAVLPAKTPRGKLK